MVSRAIIGIVSDLVRTDHLVARLHSSGFCSGTISVLAPDNPLSHIRCEKHNMAPEGALLGAASGGALGGVLGFLANAAIVTLPRAIAPLFASGLVLSLLCGISLGTLLGMLLGGVIGLFIPKFEVRQCAGILSGGNILVSVHVDDSQQVKLAKELFEDVQAQDIHCIDEVDSP